MDRDDIANEQAIELLRADIKACQKEIENIKDEIEMLEHLMMQPELFTDFALTQSRKAAETLTEIIDLECAQLENERISIAENHKQKIIELDLKMQKGIEHAYKIMNTMLIKTDRIYEPAIDASKERIVKKEEESAVRPELKDTGRIREDMQGRKSDFESKNIYIIGKVAGEDLFDKNGNLIIAKNEIITEQVVDKADREGKLIELVLEMRLQ